jgi:hypothetical protein
MKASSLMLLLMLSLTTQGYVMAPSHTFIFWILQKKNGLCCSFLLFFWILEMEFTSIFLNFRDCFLIFVNFRLLYLIRSPTVRFSAMSQSSINHPASKWPIKFKRLEDKVWVGIGWRVGNHPIPTWVVYHVSSGPLVPNEASKAMFRWQILF